MALGDALAAARNRSHGTRCRVCALLDDLVKDDAAALRDALADPKLAATTISRVLAAEGHNLPAYSIARHRRGDCLQT